ncbi:hypothetical protein VKT23_012593 [Stygiomarasmius scandens]|uniref:F-box domain-containing protein n=1 Tax=Marasmiellus scandens TaxID=2682957 RepID=A0ABR1JAJ4_9AGAR
MEHLLNTLPSLDPTQLAQSLEESRAYFSHFQSQTRNYVGQIRAGLSAYDAEIIRLEAVLATVQQKRSEFAMHLDTCESQLAPIRRLPAEILSEIFVLSASESRNFPLAATYVCKGWYDVACGTPQLWTNIDIDFSSLPPSAPHGVEICLRRSGQLPLSLRLTGKLSSDVWEDVMSSLLRESSRWRCVHFELLNQYHGTHRGSLFRMLSSVKCLPALESLHLTLELYCQQNPPTESELFRNAPLLRHLTVDGSLFPDLRDYHSPDLAYSHVSWPSLESLEVKNVRAEPTVDYLNFYAFRDLRTLSLTDIDVELGLDGDDLMIQNRIPAFQQLSVLVIHEENDDFMVDMLAHLSPHLTLPSLKSLQISVERSDTYDLVSILVDFLDAVGCSDSLTSLELKGVNDIPSVLMYLPNLETLIVTEIPERMLNRGFSESLDPLNSTEFDILVPQLSHLKLTLIARAQVQSILTRLSTMVKSRWEASMEEKPVSRALDSLVLGLPVGYQSWFSLQTKAIEALRSLEEKGLEFNIHFY